jgi:hypothetical protein
LDGIQTSELFAWNVRGGLGRTKVNKDIGKSIDDTTEHQNFLLYHNGLTVLCKRIDRDDDHIEIEGYSVVNGCQSLTSLFEHRLKITDDLRIFTRLIELSADSPLVEKITHHSNNQNPIHARDLQSNSIIQRRLQNEFAQLYPGQIFYRIKRGEAVQVPEVIDNDSAGRALLAFDLKQPWSCHQAYKVLDELHAEIFARREVTAYRIVAIMDILQVVHECTDALDNKLMGSYTLTAFVLLYLLRRALEEDESGKQFCADPGPFVTAENGRTRIKEVARTILGDLVIDLNAEISERLHQGKPFDYKRELKSPTGVRELERGVIPQYLKAINRKRVEAFGAEWQRTAPQ